MESLEPRQLLSTFTVTSTDDSGPGSLRDAIDLAEAAPGADAIEFDADLAGAWIVLSGPALQIYGELVIRGPDAGPVNITTGYEGRVFYNAGPSTTLENLTLEDCWVDQFDYSGSGGAIYNADGASLILQGCTIRGSSASFRGGAIYNGPLATLRLIDTLVESCWSGDVGGAIDNNEGTLVLSRSNLRRNSAEVAGGAIDSYGGEITISHSIISNNSAVATGGGIQNYFGNLEMVNSTLSGNDAPNGGGLNSFGVASIRNSTIASNTSGGGLRVLTHGATTLNSTIVAGNSGGDVAFGVLDPASANNLIQDSSTAGGLSDGVNANIIGEDPLISPLASNGGPTQTHALAPDSPAIGAGVNTGDLTTDQRGGMFARGPMVDIGSFQHQSFALVVDTIADVNDGNFGPGELSLREAVTIAPNPGVDTIQFAPSLDGAVIKLSGAELAVNGDILIEGPGADLLTVSAEGLSRVFSGRSNVTLVGLTIADGRSSQGGGIYHADGLLTLDSVAVVNNHATSTSEGGGGGGIFLTRSGLDLIDSTVSGNVAAREGGGLLNWQSNFNDIRVTNSTISGNAAGLRGGGIRMHRGSLTLVSTTIWGNTAPDQRGGGVSSEPVYWGAIRVLATNTIIAGNSGGDVVGTLAAGSSHNLIQSESSAGGLVHGVDGNIIGVDPLLGPLSENGGATLTHALPRNSPARDAGDLIPGLETDQRGYARVQGAATDIGAFEANPEPVLGSLSAAPDPARRGQAIELLVRDADDPYGAVAEVRFYLDTNEDGLPQSEELIGTDADGSDGFTAQFAVPADAEYGTLWFIAVVVDDESATSEPASATVEIENIRPTIGALRGSASEIEQGDPLTLTVESPSDADGAIREVRFFLDANQDGMPQENELMGTDAAQGDGFSWSLSDSQSAALSTGQASFIVLAVDDGGLESELQSFRVSVLYSVRALPGASAHMTSLSDGLHVTAVRNSVGDLIAFIEFNGTQSVLRLNDYVAAAPVTSDPIVWTDPNDGLVYVAAPSDGGFLLFRRAGDGSWSVRDLADESASGADAPVGTLTYFVTRPRSGSPLVYVVGINAAGEIVAYLQTAAAGSTEASWSLYNISDDLSSQSMTTPAFSQMTSYVTSWNQWTLAGLDTAGNVQGVWINIATFFTWRVDNLSAITGADPLTGELDVTLTTWGGIRFAGANASGRLVATWWNPGRGPGNWSQTDLTAAVPGGGAPALAGGQLTAWFTPDDRISYAGYDSNGDIVSLHWQPGGVKGAWYSDNLTSSLPNRASRPVGTITSHVAATGERSIVGVSSDRSLVRLWRASAFDTFSLDNLSEIAVRM